MIAWNVFRQGLVVGREDFRAFWTWRTWFSAWMLRIGTSSAIWVLLGRMLGSSERAEFLLVGNAVMAGPTAIGMVIASSTWDRWDGTYPFLVISPTSMLPALIGRTIIWLGHGIGTALATFVLLGAAFDVRLRWQAAPTVIVSTAIVCASSYCFMLALGALVNRAPRLRNILQNVTLPLLMAACGVNVPASFWPTWLQTVAQLLPVTHGLIAIRAALHDAAIGPIVLSLALEALVGGCWLVVAVLTVDRMSNAGRADGSIDLV